jgi:hypothetical protein
MSRLIFINLQIDQFWSKESILAEVFKVSNPESRRLSLAVYNLTLHYMDTDSSEQDVYLMTLVPDEFWLQKFNTFHQYKNKKIITLAQDPYDSKQWLKAFLDEAKKMRFDSYVFSGISDFESFFCIGKMHNEEFYKKINSKVFLSEFCKKNCISFPESKAVYGKDLQADSSVLYKFDISSGGNGHFYGDKLTAALLWVKRQGMEEAWNKSLWLKQEKINPVKEYSCFGRVDADSFQIVEIKYDPKNLSYLHHFYHEMEEMKFKQVEDVFFKVQDFLKKSGYLGFFGFDVIDSKQGFYPIIDLNVRITKTHLLAMGLTQWQPKYNFNSYFRYRFLNSLDVKFKDFWLKLCSELSMSDMGVGTEFQVLPFDVFAWSQGQAEITFIISVSKREKLKDVIGVIKEKLHEVASEV